MMRWLIGFVVLSSASTAAAGSLEISYASLERILLEHSLTEGGRRYFEGGPSDTCNYAFIQEPHVSAEGGRLQVQFLFAGSIGKQVGERCVGSGDNFPIVVSGVPHYAEGEIFLDDMRIDGESRVFHLFSGLLSRVLGSMMRVPVRQAVETAVGQLVVKSIEIEEIVLGESSLTMSTDVDLAIRTGGQTR